jgi:hypothetical protein
MKISDIVVSRLSNQRLTGTPFRSPLDGVSWLGAIQAQDYHMAKWALGMRVKNATDETIENAFNDGVFLRTHVMRPTWHFVSPLDIRWMLALTAPRVKTLMGHYNKKLELDDAIFSKTNTAIVKTLEKHTYHTRQELKKMLAELGIHTDVQRLAHILMQAELDGLICSGPRQGKQFTYALLSKRAPHAKTLSREASLYELARIYVRSHGPIQLKDFSWWSGLSVKDATEALSLVKNKVETEAIDGKQFWFINQENSSAVSPKAFLLSIYDEYTIAYKDRSALGGDRYVERLIQMGNALTAVIVLDGKIIGTWKRMLGVKTVAISLSLFKKLTLSEKKLLEDAAARYGQFVGLHPIVTFQKTALV